jgi:hypothetical protein
MGARSPLSSCSRRTTRDVRSVVGESAAIADSLKEGVAPSSGESARALIATEFAFASGPLRLRVGLVDH